MGKLSAQQRVERESVVKKYQSELSEQRRKMREKLTEEINKFLESSYKNDEGINSTLGHKLHDGLESDKYKKPSDFIKQELSPVLGTLVADEMTDSLLYSVDNCRSNAYSYGYMRRPFRSESYAIYTDLIHHIIYCYTSGSYLQVPFEKIANGDITPEQRAYIELFPGILNEYDIAYNIDNGNTATVKYISETIDSGLTDGLCHTVFRAVFTSHNAELHELTGKLLLAARLQEGLRQAICENCDCGSIEGFAHILKVITDNDLIRFSAIKRAVATWTGLVASDSGDLDRISGKTLELVNGCLSDEKFRADCLASDDAMKVHIALWATAVGSTNSCEKLIQNYCENGTHPQMLAAAYFMRELKNKELRAKLAKKLLLTRSGELDVMTLTMPHMFAATQWHYKDFDAKLFFDKNFDSKKEASDVYNTLFSLYEQIPKKELEFSPCVFPWNSEKLTKSQLVKLLIFVAAVTQDSDWVDTMCRKFSEIDVSNYGTRSSQIEMLLTNPKTDIQMEALVSEIADREEYSRKTAFKLVKQQKLSPKHYLMLENMLKYKSADIRGNVIELLLQQSSDELFETAKRLVCDKKEEKRTAGLDIITQLGKDQKRSELFERCKELAKLIEKPTSKEQILIDQLTESEQTTQESVYGYGLYTEKDSYEPTLDKAYAAECKKVFAKYFPNSELASGKKKSSQKSEPDFIKPLKSLNELIEQHKNDKYTNLWGEQRLIGEKSGYFREKAPDGAQRIPFKELWDKFYDEHINDPVLLMRMIMALPHISNFELTNKLFGSEFSCKNELAFDFRFHDIFESFKDRLDKAELNKAAYAMLSFILQQSQNGEQLFVQTDQKKQYIRATYCYVKNGKVVESEFIVESFFEEPLFKRLYDFFDLNNTESFAHNFALEHKLAENCGAFILNDYINKNNLDRSYLKTFEPIGNVYYIRAAYFGIITQGYMYKHIFERTFSLGSTIKLVSGITKSYRDSERKRMTRQRWGGWYAANTLAQLLCEKKPQITDENRPLVEFAVNIYEKLTKLVLDSELKRGDSPAEFSGCIMDVGRIYGAQRFVQILAALGKDTLERSGGYGSNISKRRSLSHLLGVCVPDDSDTAEKLGELLSKTDITEKRLVEAALYSPEWIDLVGEHLGWEGFRSACFYFMAHMNEHFDDARKAMIAKFTPITTEELSDGAFDIQWFKESYETVGEKRFDMIYDAAKYITDGAKHSRARKYADAVLDRSDRDDALKQIKDKRNKDTLMAYALLPIENEDDIFSRYLLFKQFKKESTKFGAQRRASESAASDMAMRNLAENAGYTDVTRLTLRMETKLFDDIRPLTEPNKTGDITLTLTVDENGKAEIKCEKDGKTLKSVPAKYKKDELVVRMGEVKKQLTEQYRRTRQMLEQSMENRTVFLASELDALKTNPVVSPMIHKLVFVSGKNSGMLDGMKLVSPSGKAAKLKPESELIVAHPLDLYTQGCWSDYQKLLFGQKTVQPFKQVFRELYVKTDEEKEAFTSLRYAGNQIQPAKTVSCLKTRRWVADIDDGLQKVYYKENIIARIYALADWFSPADIEAPTLEWVDFFDRKTGKQLCIKDIPDLVFSEVMRDVDLAVSVAHAGGVDPETSHSTIEMRRAVCEFTMPLFGLENVRFEKSHAFITGKRADYSVHLGSGVVHLQGGPMINILPVHSQHRGKLFLPFADEDPKTAQIISEILLFAEDDKIKDPFILEQIR